MNFTVQTWWLVRFVRESMMRITVRVAAGLRSDGRVVISHLLFGLPRDVGGERSRNFLCKGDVLRIPLGAGASLGLRGDGRGLCSTSVSEAYP